MEPLQQRLLDQPGKSIADLAEMFIVFRPTVYRTLHRKTSQLFSSGVDVRVISDRVGHLGSKITRDYAAVATEASRQAAEKAVSMISRRSAR